MMSKVERRVIIGELRQFLPSITCREVVIALEGLKVARTGLRPQVAVRLQRLGEARGFAVVVGDKPIYPRRDRAKGGWCNGLRDHGYPPGFRHVYIAAAEGPARRAYEAETCGDEARFGGLLKIPSCCQSFYLRNQDRANNYQNDFFPLVAENLNERPLAALNLGAQYFDASLLSHFPCSLSCRRSLWLARKQARIVSQYSKRWLNDIVGLLNRPVLYTEYEGVFLLQARRAYSVREVSFNPLGTMGTSNGRIAKALASGNRLRSDGCGSVDVFQANRHVTSIRSKNLRFFAPLATTAKELCL